MDICIVITKQIHVLMLKDGRMWISDRSVVEGEWYEVDCDGDMLKVERWE